MQVLENLIHRLRRFAETHTQVQTFSHGQVTDFDLDKLPTYPVMHVVWNGIDTSTDLNEMVYQFQILFADKPTIAEDKPDQALYAMNDCVNYALDLLAVIKQGEEGDIFDDDFSIASANIQAVQEAYSNVLWGCVLNIGISVHHPYNLCDAPIGTISGDFTPCTLCNVIAGKTALQILECLTAEQEAALSAELCEAAGVATYTNGAAFTQEINAGETYTAPQVQMTAVDGTTENIPANTNYVCGWKALTGEASDGNKVFEINEYPAGGMFPVTDNQYRDAGATVLTRAYRETIHVINANIASVVNDTPNDGQANLTIEVNVPVVNSAGDSVGSNVESLLIPAEVDDVNLIDSDGAVGSYPMPTTLAVVGQVNSATYSGGTLTITPAGGATGGIAPMPVFATQVNLFGETGFVEGAQIAAGIFDPPAGPFSNCQGLDYTAASPFITLQHAHLGGTARWRDSSNNALAYSDATVADGLVTDLGFDRQWYIVRQSAANFAAALAAADSATFGGHEDWRLPTRSELWTLFDLNNTNNISTIDGRPPGFDANSTNSVISCTTAELGSTFVYGTFGTNRRTQFFSKSSSVFYILVRNFGSY